MTTRLIFLAAVCMGSLAFGQGQAAKVKQNTPVPSAATPTVKIAAPVPPATVTAPASVTPAPVARAVEMPTNVNMNVHFHMGGNFDASFEMNVNQLPAKPEERNKSHIIEFEKQPERAWNVDSAVVGSLVRCDPTRIWIKHKDGSEESILREELSPADKQVLAAVEKKHRAD